MSAPPVPAEVFQALCAAFYCLHDQLVAAGHLPAGHVAWHLRRLREGEPAFMNALHGIAQNLDEMPFKPQDGPTLQVIEGGQSGGDQTE